MPFSIFLKAFKEEGELRLLDFNPTFFSLIGVFQ
jgi:hypothetical protein